MLCLDWIVRCLTSSLSQGPSHGSVESRQWIYRSGYDVVMQGCGDAEGLGITVLIVHVTDAIAMAGMNVVIAQTVATMSASWAGEDGRHDGDGCYRYRVGDDV